MSGSDIYVYVWKNRPTEEKMISAFEKNGYSIESPGEPLMAKKGETQIVVSWDAQVKEQEIGVMIYK
jgi:hypothetical protein